MSESIYFKQRQDGYKKVLADIKVNAHNRTEFENAIVEKISLVGGMETRLRRVAKSCRLAVCERMRNRRYR